MLEVAERVAFDAAEAKASESGQNFTGPLLPPTAPARFVLLPCPEDLDKVGRTAVHAIVRAHMSYFSTRAVMPIKGEGRVAGGARVGGSTDGVTYMEFLYSAERRGGRESWPKNRGEYLEFSVYKAGRSTNEVADALCRQLKIQRGRSV